MAQLCDSVATRKARRASRTPKWLGAALTFAIALAGCSSQSTSATSAVRLQVSVDGIVSGGTIPTEFSADGGNHVPTVHWKGAPSGVRSFALIVEDPDAPGSQPFSHWVVVNVAKGADHYPGTKATEGKNGMGTQGYFGPKPPAGAPHHYHFRVFALDSELPASVNDRSSAVDAMKGHAVADGEVIGTFQTKG